MDAIYIPHLLKAQNRTTRFQFIELLPQLETLTPVRGELQVTHQTTYLEVSVKAETIVTLSCHRCLNQYNHRLAINTSEMIWLADLPETSQAAEIEVEVKVEDLLETLSPRGYFEPEDWLYQQLCLALPLRQLCDGPCEIPVQANAASSEPEQSVDRRWADLMRLKQQLQ